LVIIDHYSFDIQNRSSYTPNIKKHVCPLFRGNINQNIVKEAVIWDYIKKKRRKKEEEKKEEEKKEGEKKEEEKKEGEKKEEEKKEEEKKEGEERRGEEGLSSGCS